ncbi:MAG: flagellar basal body L-ring protein FlgH, partial [Alteromonas sp.]
MRVIGCLVVVILVAGCASTQEHAIQANDPFYAPVIPDIPKETIVENGGLFNVSMVNSLYSDVKARRIGDIITVNLRENTNATKSANTTTTRESAVELNPIVGLGGQPVNVGNQSVQLGVDSSNEFTGDAQANQSNSLNGNISVTVIEVLPNQNLVIRGEKWLTLNNGDEYIRLTGIIRAAD